MIDQSTVDRVIETAQGQIVDLVSDYVNLKKRGVNYIGHCPFHNERTPSFIVSPHKGMYKCFGCGKGGNAVNFLMEHDQVSFVEAIRLLGRKFNIPVEERESTPGELAQQTEREGMMVVNEFAARFFSRALFETDEGQSVALTYFRNRGFRDDIIRKFQLGYSPEKRDAFTREAENNGFKAPVLEKVGLTIIRDGNKSDRFRGRVMFPIHGLSGKVVAFGGRVLKNDLNTAKYVNSPESEIYHKSKILYGIYQARQEISRHDRAYLVEGYTDVLAFHQAGIANVVASSGTALTAEQVRLLSRFSPNITIIFDSDQAGIKASGKGIDLVLAEGMNVKVLLLPEGEDPDSFARKHGGDKLREYIATRETDFIKYKASLLLEESKTDPIKRARLIQDIVRTIALIPEPIVRAVYVKECGSILKVEEPVLFLEISKILKKEQDKTRARLTFQNNRDKNIHTTGGEVAGNVIVAHANPFETEESEVLRFLLKYGDCALGEVETAEGNILMGVGEYIIHELRGDEIESQDPLRKQLVDLYEKNMMEPGFNPQRFFVAHADPAISSLASSLIAREYTLSKIHEKHGGVRDDKDMLHLLVPRVVTELKWKVLKSRIAHVRQLLKEAEGQNNQEMIGKLLDELTAMHSAFQVISRQQGERTVI